MKNNKLLILSFSLFIISLLIWNVFREKRYVSDSDFIMNKNTLSPDGKHRILEYQYDQGAFGESRGWTAITPPEYQNLNLVKYEIPHCYESFGWTDINEIIISMGNSETSVRKVPCDSRDQYELKTGDTVQGVKVQIVNAENFLLKQGIKRATTIPPPITEDK